MADEQHELRRVNWQEVLSFTQIFKGFRMAIHPGKLFLAFAIIALIWGGGHILDGFWAAGDQTAYQGEIYDHFSMPPEAFEAKKQAWEDGREAAAARLLFDTSGELISLSSFKTNLGAGSTHLITAFGKKLTEYNAKAGHTQPDYNEILKKAQADGWEDVVDEAGDVLDEEVKKIDTLRTNDLSGAAEKEIEDDTALSTKKDKDKAKEVLDEHLKRYKAAVTERKKQFAAKARTIEGQGIFSSLLDYENLCVQEAILAVTRGDIFTGLSEYREILRKRSYDPATVTWQPFATQVEPNNPRGFMFYLLMGISGFAWLISEHWVYAIVLLVWMLVVMALLGGALHRIAALHFAREEKISVTQALRFSAGKFFSFLTAPLIPLAIIVFLGLLLTLGGLFGSLPYVGEIIMGVLFFIAVILGLLVAFLMIGLVVGLPLMYPTIAVEGSDSFDAISRSFSYVFARPWRAALYGLVALVYGAVTYLFVRLFAYVALSGAHYFVKWGVFVGGDTLHPEADKLDVLWQAPRFDSLFGPFNWEAMNGTQMFSAVLIGICVFVVAGLVAAYLVSFFANASTIVYYLLRQKVDATDLDDVYVEESEQEELPAGEGEPTEPEPPAEKG